MRQARPVPVQHRALQVHVAVLVGLLRVPFSAGLGPGALHLESRTQPGHLGWSNFNFHLWLGVVQGASYVLYSAALLGAVLLSETSWCCAVQGYGVRCCGCLGLQPRMHPPPTNGSLQLAAIARDG